MNIIVATSARRPLVILAVAHILLGLVLGYLAEDGPDPHSLAIYCGLFFSQTSLIGIWGGLATYRWPIRLAGVTIGIAYLYPQFVFSLGRDLWQVRLFIIVVLSTEVVFIVFLVVRRFLARLVKPEATTRVTTAEGLQFSIRHLMLFTLLVGCTLAVGRWLRPYFANANDVAFILLISVCFVSVGVISVWAMLGRGNVFVRSSVVLGIAFGSAFLPAYALGHGDYWIWSMMMVVEAMCLLGSLFVVRRCGFRLVRISWNQ